MYLRTDLESGVATESLIKQNDASSNAEWKRLHLSGDLTKNFNLYSYIAMKVFPGNYLPSPGYNWPPFFCPALLWVTARNSDRVHCTAVCFSHAVWYFSNLMLTFQKNGLWSDQNFTEILAYTFDHLTAEIAQGYESGKIPTQSVWTKNQDIITIYDGNSGRLMS